MNNSRYNLLYVEVDSETVESVTYFIKNRFKNIYTAHDGESALEIMRSFEIDILLLDTHIPKINGLKLAELVRQDNKEIPILFLSACSTKENLLKALNLQIDAYIFKPLKVEQLYISFNKVIKQLNSRCKQEDVIKLNTYFDWNMITNELSYKNINITLTHKETRLIQLLYENKSRSLAFDEIKIELFNDLYIKNNAIVQIVARLRKKIKDISLCNDFFIDSIYQNGYKIII